MESTCAPWASAAQPKSQTGPAAAPTVTNAPWARAQTRRLEVTISAEPQWPPAWSAPDGDAGQAWSAATKRILSVDMLEAFLLSSTMKDFMGFILFLNEAAKGRPAIAEDDEVGAGVGCIICLVMRGRNFRNRLHRFLSALLTHCRCLQQYASSCSYWRSWNALLTKRRPPSTALGMATRLSGHGWPR